MNQEQFRYLAAVIAAHPEKKIVGRTRLQKTIKLLQRLGLPTDYSFMNYFYGPYSEGIQFDIGLLEEFGLIREHEVTSDGGNPLYIIEVEDIIQQNELDKKIQEAIDILAKERNTDILEIAATYDAFREMGSDHDDALERLRRKKAKKCTPQNLKKADSLLKQLNLLDEKRSLYAA
ncbi:MAG TPA: hypothetical protein PLY86_15370 [bacterium]|nr:hypothetical protein [bacterium]